MIDLKQTLTTKSRYQRISAFYDLLGLLPEKRFSMWRQHLWSMVKGPKVLEVGIGTGKNIPFYPDDVRVTAIDLTPGMLQRAQNHAKRINSKVDLRLGDVQALAFSDASFDSAVATFVFCSVPNPALGFSELKRVVKNGGQVFLLEHVRSKNTLMSLMMDFVNPLVVRTIGANINRDTIGNLQLAGLKVIDEEYYGLGDVFRLIIARAESSQETL